MKVELISWTNDPINTAAQACAICYNSEPSPKLVKQCIASGHLSTIEHVNFTFKISGVSRSLTHQLVRHRIASYSQQSQRYVDMSNVEFVYPPYTDGYQGSEYRDAFNNAIESYKTLQDLGVKNEDARAVLPNACPTEIIMTMNLRSLGHFMNERLCTRSQQEIKTMALSIIGELKRNKDVMGLNDEEMEIILSLCVPKCESGKIKFCPEYKSCGRQKTAKEINTILAKNIESKWINDGGCLICSNCKTAYSMPFTSSNYCPNCGQKMGNIIKE